MSQAEDEDLVLCTPAAPLFEQFRRWQGFLPNPGSDLLNMISKLPMAFQPRKPMEDDPSWKQVIPYVLCHYQAEPPQPDEAPVPKFYAYRRTPKAGEVRLHKKRSIGLGGHIAPTDIMPGVTNPQWHGYIMRGAHRELDEEVQTSSGKKLLLPLGLLNDESNSVGRVHLGIVFGLYGESDIKTRCDEHTDDGFYSVPDLRADRESFESWSQILLDAMGKTLHYAP